VRAASYRPARFSLTEFFSAAWQFGDVSCKSPSLAGLRPGDPDTPVTVTVSVPGDTPAVFVLSQIEDRYYQDLAGPYQWSFEFIVYARNGEEPVAITMHDIFWERSVAAEVDLEAGEYVVHVRVLRTRACGDQGG
jgi:hypothetical protein